MKAENRGACVDALERRLLLEGNIKAALQGGDLVVWGDKLDNVVKISRPAAGKVRVAGLEDTIVNGGTFKDFSAGFDGLKILMRQGGADQVSIRGPIRIAGDLGAQLGDGELVIEGSVAAVEIGENLSVQGGAHCDVRFRNEVIVTGNTTITTGGDTTAHANLGILPDFRSARFSNSLDIDNPYFPLVPGTVYTYEEKSIDEETGKTITQTDIFKVTNQTKTILGVKVRVIDDRVFENGHLIEQTFDWHAQDDNGNVWYFGEDVTNFEYDEKGNLIDKNKHGSWTAGINGGRPGIIMEARPHVGDRYYQEFFPGAVLDQGEVVATHDKATVPAGSFNNLVRTRDTTVIEPEGLDNKLYAPGVGVIKELSFDLQSGEQTTVVRLLSVKLNGKTVTSLVPTSGFNGVNPTGKATGPIRMGGETAIDSKGTVILRQSRFGDTIDVFSDSQVTVADSVLEDLSIGAGDSVGLRNVTATEEVRIRGDVDVYILGSKFQNEVGIWLGNGDNELVVQNSSFRELNADGGRGDDAFDDRGGNSFGDLVLRRFDA
jgi:hypothetical protein